MTVARFTACSLALVGALVLASSIPAADAPPKAPAKSKKTSAAAAEQEREKREDLERRVEKLEQQYEMKEPTTRPPDTAAPRKAAP